VLPMADTTTRVGPEQGKRIGNRFFILSGLAMEAPPNLCTCISGSGLLIFLSPVDPKKDGNLRGWAKLGIIPGLPDPVSLWRCLGLALLVPLKPGQFHILQFHLVQRTEPVVHLLF